jgi:CRP-like cAMP-binding protein
MMQLEDFMLGSSLGQRNLHSEPHPGLLGDCRIVSLEELHQRVREFEDGPDGPTAGVHGTLARKKCSVCPVVYRWDLLEQESIAPSAGGEQYVGPPWDVAVKRPPGDPISPFSSGARRLASHHRGRMIADSPLNLHTARVPGRNRLLRAIPADECGLLLPHLELVELEPLQLLADIGEPIGSLYFPETGIISLVSRVADGTLIENGTIGCEGMAGFPLLLGVEWTPSIMLGEVPGTSWRLDAGTFGELRPALPTLEALLGRYVVYFFAQVSQSLACNSLHTLEQRCARWLLMTHDRVSGDEFLLTHEVLAQMLAVHRPAVSVAAEALRSRGLIEYTRGKIRVSDRAGLEGFACECYGIVRDHRDRLLGVFED